MSLAPIPTAGRLKLLCGWFAKSIAAGATTMKAGPAKIGRGTNRGWAKKSVHVRISS
jgi:hypothetical protein